MEQSHRILSIYTRLIQQKVVNKEQLAAEWHVSPRTIQRDICNIRNFLYESNAWQGHHKEILYNHQTHSYILYHSEQEDHLCSIYFLLTLIQTITPVINQPTYNYLKLLIQTFHSGEASELLSQLKQLKIQNHLHLQNLMLANRAIWQKQKLYFNDKREVVPLNIRFYGFTFYLVYRFNQQTMIESLNTKEIALSPERYVLPQSKPHYSFITFKIHASLYESLKHSYEYEILKPFKEGFCIARFKMSAEDAINICFSCRHQIFILKPEPIRHQVLQELLKTQEFYMMHNFKLD